MEDSFIEDAGRLVAEFLDMNFFLKYSIIISNFVIIIALILLKRGKLSQDADKKNILLVTAHPDDESM